MEKRRSGLFFLRQQPDVLSHLSLRDCLYLFFVNLEFNKLFFGFRDQKVVCAPRKTRINNRYSCLWFLLPLIFSFKTSRR